MSGFQEILLILFIAAALFVIPRMVRRPATPAPRHALRPRLPAVSGKLRLAILGSAIWLGLAAAYFEPWSNGWLAFAYLGVGPAAVAWGALWVVRGFRNRSR